MAVDPHSLEAAFNVACLCYLEKRFAPCKELLLFLIHQPPPLRPCQVPDFCFPNISTLLWALSRVCFELGDWTTALQSLVKIDSNEKICEAFHRENQPNISPLDILIAAAYCCVQLEDFTRAKAFCDEVQHHLHSLLDS